MYRAERKGNTIRLYRYNELIQEITFPEGVEVMEKDGHFVGFHFPEPDKEPSLREPSL